jgi:DnaK suppressor protein
MSDAALNQQQIAEVRGLLEERKQQLESQLADGDTATKPVTLDQQSVGRVSRIDAIQQQQMAIANQQQASQLLQRVVLALRRIDTGEYGYCLRCDETIEYARLQAQPFTSLCLECQSASETA